MTTSVSDLHRRHCAIIKHWTSQSKDDPEFGGPDFERNLAIAKRAVDKFGGAKLRKVLDESGVGNHPDVIRAFWKMGRTLAPKPTSIAQAFYPGFNP